jgi:Xaa-Pro aminopeptidase
MILSNEPGFYKEGAYGIRIENLIVVQQAAPIAGGDARAMLEFETLTLAPIDRRLVVSHDMAAADTAWLNEYHARVAEALMPLVPPETQAWLRQATAPIA